MAIPNLTDEQLQFATRELQQALYNHEQWSEMLAGTLICRLTPDERDISPNAHRLCRFAQWYYKSGIAGLERHPGFAEIGIEHQRMHQYAANMLRSSMDGVPIPTEDYERFVTAMKRMRLEIATLQRELQGALSNLDPLTGTPSRIGMLTSLREQRELVHRSVQACVIAMMDLDHFKLVNDTYGHVVGDRVLVDTAQYIMRHMRPYDKLFRYGGEEFLICLPETDLEAGRNIVDRLRRELGSLAHEADGRPTFHVTVSFGLTLLDPEASVEESIDRADKALYVAKTTGRDRSVAWDASMSQTTAISPETAVSTQ
ncbi:MAG TPA: diguanylate cyclase [Bauldia sp.]|nr:diguanylate cyclase [Bauldia sp.]